jgi:hypothetical protein
MLPRINAQQRPELSDHRILIRISLDADRARLRILHQPRPARTLDTGERGVEFFFQGVEVAVGGVDGLCQGARGWVATAAGLGS